MKRPSDVKLRRLKTCEICGKYHDDTEFRIDPQIKNWKKLCAECFAQREAENAKEEISK